MRYFQTQHRTPADGLAARREMYLAMMARPEWERTDGDYRDRTRRANLRDVARRLARTVNTIADKIGMPEMRVSVPAGLEVRTTTATATGGWSPES